jgi:serine/threonine protein kinase/tetratricopeptide (TPR) repeat protein
MTIQEGTQFGPYRILEKIGSGGMGEVYRALDTRLEREVALKLVSENYLATEIGSGSPSPGMGTPHSRAHLSHERFLREARSAATLNHPNICAIHDVGEQDGRPYLVMELLRGETLKLYLANAGGHGLTPAEVLAFGQQAASALAAAHAQGIIHRDIKPANLFVTEAGRGRKQIKILDFGLAKRQGMEASPDSRTMSAVAGSGSDATSAMGMTGGTAALDLTTPGSTVGTVSYMSPEQARGAPLDARTDLFSLGTVIYEMATGKKPFDGDSTADVFAALLVKEPLPVTSVNPGMPPQLDPIETRLLAKDKAQRYQTAEDLLGDLEAVPVPQASGSGSAAAATSGSGSAAAGSSGHSAAVSGIGAASGVSGAGLSGMRAAEERDDAEKAQRGRKNILIAAVVAVLLIAAGLFVAFRHSGPPTPPQTPTPGATVAAVAEDSKDSVIIADFVNQTGDPVFDTTLNQALTAQLSQSPVLSIVSQQHLRQSLGFLGKKQDDPITPAIAREIGEREGIKAILTGTIANLGKQYLITLTAQNTATGDQIATVEAQAAGKEAVLDTLDKAAAQMRAKLGEDLASIKKLNAPFGQATTPSLEAFRAYALGDLAHQKGNDIPEAEGHYRRALELDPKLAMAWARLGVIYLNSGQVGSAMEYFTKAHDLTANVSEREKLYIDGHYYTEVLGDLNKGSETLEVATQEYPLQIDNFINLGAIYQSMGQMQKGQDEELKALALQPDDAVALGNVFVNYAQLDQPDEAKKYLAQIKKLGLNGTSIETWELTQAAAVGDTAGVQRIVAETAGRPDQFTLTGVLAQTQAETGQFKLAEATFRQAAEQSRQNKAPDAQAGFLISAASVAWPLSRCEDVEGAEKQALKLDKSKPTQMSVAIALAACGDTKRGTAALNDLAKKYPQDTVVQQQVVPEGLAWLALKAGQPQKAVDLLERARPWDSVSPGGYIRGLAYLELHDAQNAIAAFQAATRYRGYSITSNNPYALGLLGLGRAYAMAGNKAEAKKAYDRFFTEWKNADSDLPVLAEAKKEYAAL